MALTLEQLDNRANSLGGSDAAAAVGISPFKTPLELYLEKTGAREPDDISDVNAVYWGNVLEDTVAEEYARRTNNRIEVVEDTLYHPVHKFMTAHLDRRLVDIERVLECKTTNAWAAIDWGQEDTDEVPMQHIIQTSHYMSVTGYSSADVAVLIGGQDYRIYRIERDDDLIASLEQAELVFWNRVKTLNPPDPSNLEDLKLIYGVDDGRSIEATHEIQAAWESLKNVKKNLKSLDKEKDDLEYTIKKFMASNTTLLRAGDLKPLATWKSQDNNRFQTTRFQADQPGLYADYVKNNPTRVMRLKNPKLKK